MKKIITISLLSLSLFGATNIQTEKKQNYFFDFSSLSCVNEGDLYKKAKQYIQDKTIIEVGKNEDLYMYKFSELTEENKEDIFVSSETKKSCEEYKKIYLKLLLNMEKN